MSARPSRWATRHGQPDKSKQAAEHAVPPGWSVEEDRREEFLALSYLASIRKVTPCAD